MSAEFQMCDANKAALCFVSKNNRDSWTADRDEPIQSNMSQLSATLLLPLKKFKH